LIADARHTLSDVFVSMAVLASLLLSRSQVPRADSLVALGVLGFVGWAAWQVVRQAVGVLADSARLDPSAVAAVCLPISGVRGVREVRSRGMEGAVQVDLKLDVDPAQTVAAAHQTADAVEEAIIRAFPVVHEVVVHVEPASRG
jgi:cation diffusion facilitator family transporter